MMLSILRLSWKKFEVPKLEQAIAAPKSETTRTNFLPYFSAIPALKLFGRCVSRGVDMLTMKGAYPK